MPEGHTLHRLAGDYARLFGGRATRSSSPQGRFGAESARIDGRVLTGADAYGKHLFCHFEPAGDDRAELTVHVHLGLAGKIFFADHDDPPVVGAIRWRLSTADADPVAGPATGQHGVTGQHGPTGHTADLRGPAVCELLTPDRVDAVIARLGPDPLRDDADPDAGWRRVSRSSLPIAALLMDQQVAAGVGNIYRAELLYRHRIDPMMSGRLLKHREWQAMWTDLSALMRLGVQTGRIDTVRPEHEPEAMGRAPRVDAHGGEVYVYRRAGQPCLVCGSKVRLAELAGRNLFWCPRCQRRSRRQDR